MVEIDWKQTVLVFVVGILTECCYTGYAHYVAKADTVRGPIFAGLIAVGKAVLVIAYVHEPMQVAVLAVAQMIGTWVMLRVIKKGDRYAHTDRSDS